jgi:site-specific DNA recombinase
MNGSIATIVRCVIYLRVSLDATGEMLAIARQRKECLAIAAARGWTVVAEFADNSVSAYSRTKIRPGYAAMVQAYKDGKFDALVCWDLDRLTRQPRQLEDWIDAAQDKGLLLVTANGEADLTNDNGILFAGIKANVARAESARKAARQRAALKQRAEAGRPPLGVRLTGYTTAGEVAGDEAAIVRQMFERFYMGDSLRGIAGWLGQQAAPTRHGGPWGSSSVRAVLTNPRYAGRSYYNRKQNGLSGPCVPGTWPPLVEEWLFEAVEVMLAGPQRRKQVGTDRKHLGSGLYLCGVCGGPVRSHASVRAAGGPSRLRYRCPAGGHITRTAGPVDDLVVSLVCLYFADPRGRPAFDPGSQEARAVTEEIRRLGIRLRKTELDYDADLIDGGRYKAKKEKLAAELDAAEVKRAQLTASPVIGARLAAAGPGLAAVRAEWDALPLGSRRTVLAALMTVRLAQAPRGRHFDPASVRIEWRIDEH